MVPLPLFKLAALFVRHISKYGANRIKVQAHEHERFRHFAARYGQAIHQLNMRLNVALLRNVEAEKRARDKAEAAEAPTVKTKEQIERELRAQQKEAADRAKYGTTAREAHPVTALLVDSKAALAAAPSGVAATGAAAAAGTIPGSGSGSGSGSGASTAVHTAAAPATTAKTTRFTSVWTRKFRPLPEAKAVDLFADVAGDAFILVIASALLLFEYYRSASKPDTNTERYKDLSAQLAALRAAEEEHIQTERLQESRILAMEAALRSYHDPKTKQPLLADKPAVPPAPSPPATAAAA